MRKIHLWHNKERLACGRRYERQITALFWWTLLESYRAECCQRCWKIAEGYKQRQMKNLKEQKPQ